MAEFPDLGKSCSLKACNKLDFTPFLCSSCEKYFCGEHRLHHDCQLGNVNDAPTPKCASKPLKPYLCSMEGCFVSETVRIDCQQCGFSFCLKHRYPEEHHCRAENTTSNEARGAVQQELKKKVEEMIAASNESNVAGTSTPAALPVKKRVMSETERKRADRIAVMRLKSTTRSCNIPDTEQMFLFVVRDEERAPVMVSKRWTIGRCVDQIANQFSIPNNNATFGTKMLRLYSEVEQSKPLPMADNIEKHLKDLSNVFLKRDE